MLSCKKAASLLGFFWLGFAMAQTGPGGVGNTLGTSTLKVWVRADAGVTQAAGKISQWSDQSGSGNHLTMATAANQPGFVANVFNGFPAVRYIGSSSQYFNSAFSGPGSNGISIFLFAKGTSYESLIRYQNQGGVFLVYPWEVGGGRTFITSSDGGTGSGLASNLTNSVKNIGTARYNINTATSGFQTFLNGGLVAQRGSVNATLPSEPFFSGRYNPGASEYPTADVPEIIIFYSAVNEAQRMIVENYLAAKYDTLLAANDLYLMDNAANGNYDYDVAGIGQASDGSNQLDSRGTGIVEVSNPGGLASGEFFFWGKNNIPLGVTTTTNTPTAAPQSVQTRWAAEWRAGETGDVGTTDISFDLTGFTPATASDLRLIIDTDNDGLFSNEVNGTGVLSGATALGGNVYGFTGVNINNGQRFTLGSVNSINTTLPITLLDFSATVQQAKVLLVWTTASEKNNAAFELYRSANGVSWQLINTQKGANTTNSRQAYAFTDEQPFAGMNYYKLNNVDLDGKHTASGIISADVTAALPDITVYINASGEIVLAANAAIQTADVELTTLLGQKITLNWQSVNDKTLVSSGHPGAGIYVIKYRVNEDAFQYKKLQLPE